MLLSKVMRSGGQSFLVDLGRTVLVADGAMGTMLYAEGAFLNKAFEELNLSDPQRVTRVHRAYVAAGADVIETNTFGANRLKLASFGLQDRLAAVNTAAVELARTAAAGKAYVAGAIGPLGVRIAPAGRLSRSEAAAVFREQAAALQDAGVDLFVLETFRTLAEARVAVGAVRGMTTRPIVAQVATDGEGCTADGSGPERFGPALVDAGADVVGVNCGAGPAPMLEVVERLAPVVSVPVAVQPNAGLPREVEGRLLYLSSPEFVAAYARRFIDGGAALVGGCCGMTPDHIRAIRAKVGAVPCEPVTDTL